MPDPSTLLAFALASIVLLVVPGPTIALVIARTLSGGQRAAAPLVLGVGLGDLVAATVSLAGVGALLATSAAAFTVIKTVGALYLVWIAIKLWREPVRAPDLSAPVPGDGAWRSFRDAFLVTLFNPKGIVFFIAFVPQFIAPDRPYTPQAATFVLLFTALGMANGALYAWGADGMRRMIGRAGILRAMSRTGALVIGAAGVATLFARRA